MRATTEVNVEKGQYNIEYTTGGTCARTRDYSMMLHPAPEGDEGGVKVLPGLFDGSITVTVETGADVTPQVDADWERAEELVITGQGEDLFVCNLFDGPEGLPPVPLAAGQRYRLRLYARGVAEGTRVHMLPLDAPPVEHHLIQITPL